MMDETTLIKLSHLARLKLTKEEQETLVKQLIDILNFVQELSQVNTEGVEPFRMFSQGTPMREDVPKMSLSHEEALMNAPHREDGFFVVPRIVEV